MAKKIIRLTPKEVTLACGVYTRDYLGEEIPGDFMVRIKTLDGKLSAAEVEILDAE